MNEIKPAFGAVKKKKRLGRGPGSGKGKTCGKGHKGQKARKGGGVRIGFEGGQTPLYRRLPKRGFNNARFTEEFNEINVFSLDKFKDGSTVNKENMIKKGLIKNENLKIKILGDGDITKKIEVHADRYTKSAAKKIEKAGGKAILTVKDDKAEKVGAAKKKEIKDIKDITDNKEEKTDKEIKDNKDNKDTEDSKDKKEQ